MLDDLIFFTKINEFIKNRAIFFSIFFVDFHFILCRESLD